MMFVEKLHWELSNYLKGYTHQLALVLKWNSTFLLLGFSTKNPLALGKFQFANLRILQFTR